MLSKTECLAKPNESLKRILKEFRDTYNKYIDIYYDYHIKSLPPGAVLPKKDRIYSNEGIEDFNKQYVLQYRELADCIFDRALEDVHKKMTTAPGAEISAMIGMLATRDKITDAEITHLLDEYGDNHQVYKAIQDIARKHDITVLDDELTSRESELLSLRHTIETALSVNTAQTYGNSYYDFLDIAIDDTIAE